jgi:hypothetical protein
MTKNLHEQWPPASAPFEEHAKHLHIGNEILHGSMTLPEDGRFSVAYILLAGAQGPEDGVSATGTSGSGKTEFGKLLVGANRITQFSPTDQKSSLFGHESVLDGKQMSGSLGSLVGPDPVLVANELGNLANMRDLLQIWDTPQLEVNGTMADVGKAAIYATTNFPEGADFVHPFDKALASRLAVQIVTGDSGDAAAAQIYAHNSRSHFVYSGKDGRNKVEAVAPILPPADARIAIGEHLEARYPANTRSRIDIANYLVALIKGLNGSGLVSQISGTDKRLSTALYSTARARMFYTNEKAGTPVSTLHVAQVAALVMPKLITLSGIVREQFLDEIDRRPTPLENAVGVRRIVATEAIKTHYANAEISSTEKVTKSEHAAKSYSYADASSLGIDLDQLVYGGRDHNRKSDTHTVKETRRGFSLRKRS